MFLDRIIEMIGKIPYSSKTLLRIFAQCFEDDGIDVVREAPRPKLAWRRRLNIGMRFLQGFPCPFCVWLQGIFACEKMMSEESKSILIGLIHDSPVELLWCHICGHTTWFFCHIALGIE